MGSPSATYAAPRRDWGQTALRLAVEAVGLRPLMLGADQRLLIRMGGIDSQLLRDVLRRIDQLRDWPYAWEDAGDRALANADSETAFLCYYAAQRPLLSPSRLKRRLYGMAVAAYAQVPRRWPLERLSITGPAGRIAGWLQLPGPAREPMPCALLVPGITATKEELDLYCAPLLMRGVAVARVDNPGGFGESEGLLTVQSISYLAEVAAALAADRRLDPRRMVPLGLSMGGLLALHGALHQPELLRRVVTVGAPCSPHVLLPQLKRRYRDALTAATGLSPWQLGPALQRVDLAPHLPHRQLAHTALHGRRDGVIPRTEGQRFAERGSRLVSLDGTHACLEATDWVLAHLLEQLRPTY